jgi:hypothetical protein
MFVGAALKAVNWCSYQRVRWSKIHTQLLGALAELRKATLIVVMSVRPSAWNNLISTGMDFHEIWYLPTFRILCEYLLTFVIPR